MSNILKRIYIVYLFRLFVILFIFLRDITFLCCTFIILQIIILYFDIILFFDICIRSIFLFYHTFNFTIIFFHFVFVS